MPSKKQQPKTPAAAPAPAAPPAATADAATAEVQSERSPVLMTAYTDLGRVRALPLAPEGSTYTPDDVQAAPGTIVQFADEDGTAMRVVNVGGMPHKAPAPVTDPQPETEEA